MSAAYVNRAGEVWTHKLLRYIGVDEDGDPMSELIEYAVSDRTGNLLDLSPYSGDVTEASLTGILG